MKHQKMPLKVFTEEYTRILDTSSADDLRAMLIGMAHEIDSQSRWDFIEKLVPANAIPTPPITFETDILDEIESLKEDILEQGQEEPDWEYDDEDSLGEYEKFLQSLSDLFGKVEALFEAGHYEMAKVAYKELFSIFEIEDEYGRGIRIYDAVNTDLEEARARYFCSLYLTTHPDERVPVLLEVMEELAEPDFQAPPKLQDMLNITTSLPELSTFLEQWIEETKTSEKPSHDAWLREATFLLYGSIGLRDLAKWEGYKRPRVYVDWMKSLVESQKYHDALWTAHTALKQLPEGKPIRAAIGDLMALCGEQLGDEKVQFEGLWVSFKAKPDLSKLIILYEKDQSLNRISLMKEAAEVIATHLKQSDRYSFSRSWEKDDLESPPRVSSILFLHAHLFADDLNKAFELAKKGTSLGWSSGNPQPLFITYCLINAAKASLNNLPKHLKKFWEYALQTSDDSIWNIEGETNEARQKLAHIYQDIFAMPRKIDKKMVDWCLDASHKRVEDIVINQHRKAYDLAALVTAACTETLQTINPSEATKFFWEIQNKFPRHSSFQAELGRVNIVK